MHTQGKRSVRNISTPKMKNVQSRPEKNAHNDKAQLLENKEYNKNSIRDKIFK